MLAIPLARRAIAGPAAVAGAKLVFSASTIAAYGYHRDELYLEQCGRHLAWGFIDHGPLVPALSFLASHAPGPPLVAARIFSSLAAAATALLAARAARLLGGSVLAQTLAALLVAIAPLFVWSGGVFGTSAFDQLFWTLSGWSALRVAGREQRGPAWLGACIGFGILAKPTMILGAACIAAAMLASRPRTDLRRLGIAGAVAAAIAAPLALWEQAHGWPGIAFLAASRAAEGSGPLAVALDQLRLLGPFSCAAAVAGALAALRRGADVRLRVAALPWLFAVVAVAAAGGKPYYAASAAPLAIAAGCVALADRVVFQRLTGAALGIAAAIQCAGALPLLPRFSIVTRLHPDLVQFADWPALVTSIVRLRESKGLGPDVPVLTDSYGTAAALERFGGPPVLSGSNAFGSWAWERTPDEPDRVLAIGYPPALLRRFFRSVEPAGAVEAPGDNHYDFPRQAWLCAGRIASLRRGWAAFTHYD